MSEKIVTIFGSAGTRPGEPAYRLAARLGKTLARAGLAIANGGYGGTMLAAAKAASEAGGKTIGVTCRAFNASANPYISREIPTDSIRQRLDTLVELGLAYIVLPGGTGTLLELTYVWELKNKHLLGDQKPIILAGQFWKPLVELIATEDAGSRQHVIFVDRPDHVKKYLTTND